MNTMTENTATPTKTKIAVYLRYPKEPNDKSIIQQRIDAMTSVAAAGEDWELAGVYTDIGVPTNEDTPFPNFDRMRQDHSDGKFDILLTEPPHRSYRDMDAGMDYLLELRETGADIIFTNGQTMPELLAISVFRSTMKALALVEAVAVQELNALCGEDDMEPAHPIMSF